MIIRSRLGQCGLALALAAMPGAFPACRDAETQAPAPANPPLPAKAFVDRYAESGLVLKDSVSGDLNKDSLPDLVLLFSGRKPLPNPAVDTVAPRPLVILVGTGKGLYRQASANWNAVLCETCGNRLGDPYEKIVIKDGYFSLEHAASGSVMGWNRITTFKYSDSLQTWILNRDGMISRNICSDTANCGKPVDFHVIRTRKDFGHMHIDSFNIYALDDHYQDFDSSRVLPLSFGPSPSYMGWHRVRGGIWNILDFCTGNLSEGYMFFAKNNGNAYESESEEEMSVLYHLVTNVKAHDTCEGLAVKGIPSVKPGKVRNAGYDSAANFYHLGKDTIRFYREKLPSDPNWNLFVFKRGQDTLILSSSFADAAGSSVVYSGDINGDGYLDFIEEYLANSETTNLYLSKKDSEGRVRMELSGSATFTE